MKQGLRHAGVLACLVCTLGAGLLMGGCASSEETSASSASSSAEAVATSAEEETAASAEESSATTSKVVEAGQEAEGDKEAAEALVGQSLSRDDIEAAVGAGERFEMSSQGCERGVYGGYFYYSNFTLFTRTYDRGNSFTVVRVDQ